MFSKFCIKCGSTFTAQFVKAPKHLKLEGRYSIGLLCPPLYRMTHSQQAGKTTANRLCFLCRAHREWFETRVDKPVITDFLSPLTSQGQ